MKNETRGEDRNFRLGETLIPLFLLAYLLIPLFLLLSLFFTMRDSLLESGLPGLQRPEKRALT